MSYKQIFYPENIIDILNSGEKSPFEISNALKCSQSTVNNLLKLLLTETPPKIKRRNVRGGDKPFWLYSLVEKQ